MRCALAAHSNESLSAARRGCLATWGRGRVLCVRVACGAGVYMGLVHHAEARAHGAAPRRGCMRMRRHGREWEWRCMRLDLERPLHSLPRRRIELRACKLLMHMGAYIKCSENAQQTTAYESYRCAQCEQQTAA